MLCLVKTCLLLFLVLPASLLAEPPIDGRIAEAVAAGDTPVVFVDLDATLYSERARVRHLLERFDRENGTKLFKEADLPKFTSLPGLEQAIRDHLNERVPNQKERLALWNKFAAHEEKYRFHPDSIASDEVDRPLVEAISKWEKAGAQVVFLTGRDASIRDATLKKLSADGLGRFALHSKQPGQDTALFKATAISIYLSSRVRTRAVALVDDDLVNLQSVSERHPRILVLRNTQESPDELKLDSPLESGASDTAHRYGRFRSKWTYEPSWDIEFLPSRRKVHEEIGAKFEPKNPAQAAPIILFTAGIYGSGKSYVVNQLVSGGVLDPTHFTDIDPDKIRKSIPEYLDLLKASPEQASSLVQYETGHIQEQVLNKALNARVNIVLQGTLRSEAFNQKLFEDIRKNYPEYRIGIVWVHADPQVAAKRAASGPYRDGRVVPAVLQQQAVKDVPEVVSTLAPLSDFIVQVDNTDKPKLVAINRGGEATPFDLSFQAGDREGLNPEVARVLEPLLSPTPPCLHSAGRLKEQPPASK